MKLLGKITLLTLVIISSILVLLHSRIPVLSQPSSVALAFPGAEGYGKYTQGGRDGPVLTVTNLEDSGPGSLREAVEASGPRTIVFSTSGTIDLRKDIEIKNPFVTIDGQSAPGSGIQIKGGMIRITTNDVIIRYLKVRPGNPRNNAAETDPISISGNSSEVYNVVIDHCTLIWGTDVGGVSILSNSHDITIQNSIIGEGLNLSDHPDATRSEDGHSMGLNITNLRRSVWPKRISIYRNLITSNNSRNPQIMGAENVDLINNVIYNWGSKAAFGNPRSLNMINNYFIKGPLSSNTEAWSERTNSDNPKLYDSSVWEEGTVMEGIEAIRGTPNSIYSSQKFESGQFNLPVLSPQDTYNWIIGNAGANLPVRDEVDQRIISNLVNRTFVHPNGRTPNHFINASELRWPEL